jgi:hypothetical protein
MNDYATNMKTFRYKAIIETYTTEICNTKHCPVK